MTASYNLSGAALPEKQLLMSIREETDQGRTTKLWKRVGWYYENNKNGTKPANSERFWEVVDTIQETDGLLLSLLDQFGIIEHNLICLLGSIFKHVEVGNATQVLHQVAASPNSKFLDNFLKNTYGIGSVLDLSMLGIRVLYYISREQCKLCDQCHVLPILSEYFIRHVADKADDKNVVEGFCILVANIMMRHSKKARLFIVNSGIFLGVTRLLKARFQKDNSLLDLDNHVQAGYFTPNLNEVCVLNIWLGAFLSITEDLEFCNRAKVKSALGIFMPLVSHYVKQLLRIGDKMLPSDSFKNILGILKIVKHLEADGLECILTNAPNLLFEDFDRLFILQDENELSMPLSFSSECFENVGNSVKAVNVAAMLIDILIDCSCSLSAVSQSMLCIMSLIEHDYEPFVMFNKNGIVLLKSFLTSGRSNDDQSWPPKTGIYGGRTAIEISLEMILTLFKKEPRTVTKILLNDGGTKIASLINLIERLQDKYGYNEIILRNKVSRIVKELVKSFSAADQEMTIHLVPFFKESLHKTILMKNLDSLLAQENGSPTYLFSVLQTVMNVTLSHDAKLIQAFTKEDNLLSSIISVLNLSRNEKVVVNVLQILHILTSKDLLSMDLLRKKLSFFWRKRRISPKSDILLAKLLTSYFLKMPVSDTNTKFAEPYLEQFLTLDSFKSGVEMPGALFLYWTICRSRRNCHVLKILERRSDDTYIDIQFGDISAAKVYKYLCDIIVEVIDRDPPCDSKHLMDLTKCMIKIAESTSAREELYVLEDLVPASMELSGRVEDKIVIGNIEKFLSIIA